jgi:glycosyltransferase involved in cell wall biosynthesis
VELAQHFLGELVGEDRVFLTVESRAADRETLTFRRPNVKHLVVLHNPHLAGSGADVRAIRPSYRPMFEHQDALDSVVFLTNAQRADAEARYGRRENFRVVPHPMTGVRQVPFEQRDPDLVVMLARLDPQKRLADAVKAFALVVRAVPSARLEIYGRGEEQAELQRQIDALGLGGSVTLAGYTTDSSAVLERAALSLLTSRFEGYPLALLETLAHGCPVVSYDVRYGPREIIADGVNGYLVEPGDHEALARRVVEVLGDQDLRRRLSEHAGALSPEFSERTFVARWSKIFHDLDAQGWDAHEPAAPAGAAAVDADPAGPDPVDPGVEDLDTVEDD